VSGTETVGPLTDSEVMSGPGLVADLLEGLGFPVRRVAQASLALLAVIYFVSPATFRAGVNVWVTGRVAQAEQMSDRLVHDLIAQLDLHLPTAAPTPAPTRPVHRTARPQP
jgi:hypothetical protein